jgi:hypothetical protein
VGQAALLAPVFKTVATVATEEFQASSVMLSALQREHRGLLEVVLVGPEDRQDSLELW